MKGKHTKKLTQSSSPRAEENRGFQFTPENLEKAQQILTRYPSGRQGSAILPLLDLAQRQNGGWLPQPAIDYIADFLSIPHVRAYEVASFYTLFNTKPIGKYQVQVCGTTPCMLRGNHDILASCERHLGIQKDQTTSDGLFTLREVECLGACIRAPFLCINDEYFDDLDDKKVIKILDRLKGNLKTKDKQNSKKKG